MPYAQEASGRSARPPRLDDLKKVLTAKSEKVRLSILRNVCAFTKGANRYKKDERRVVSMEKAQTWDELNLPGETYLNLDASDVDLDVARKAALERVKKYDSDPMLLAWYERKSGRISPRESCEGEGGQPGWVNYAKNRGADLSVNVNHGEYIFIFKSEHGFPV
jgi:hypothetical protein